MKRQGSPQLAVAYMRVSLSKQAEHGISLEAQQARCKAWCDGTGHALDSEWTDAGLSGAKAWNRPALQSALDRVCKVKGTLVVYSLSRLARSTRDLLEIADRLNKAGAQLVSLSESIDSTTAAGRMIFTILGAVHQFEREVTAERTSAVALYRLSKGEYIGGPAPYGLARDGERTVPNADEQAVIRWIVAEAARGKGASAIARRLNQQTIPCRGSKWHKRSVQRILGRVSRATESAA